MYSFFLRTEDGCLACENIAQAVTAATTKATPSDPQPRHPFWVPESTNWLWMRNNNCRMVSKSTSGSVCALFFEAAIRNKK